MSFVFYFATTRINLSYIAFSGFTLNSILHFFFLYIVCILFSRSTSYGLCTFSAFSSDGIIVSHERYLQLFCLFVLLSCANLLYV